MRLSDVQHQHAALDRIQRGLRSGRLPHALLFAGPDGVGRELTATRLAGVLLCTRPVETHAPASAGQTGPWRDLCGACTDCELLASGGHPDVHRIHRGLVKHHSDATVRSRKALELSIDVVRQFMLEPMMRRSARGGAKVFIVVEAELLSTAAQNCLLKTLEEPPDDACIILLSAALHAMLPTTRSRCQTIEFGSLPIDFVAERVVAAGHDPVAARYYAELSGGRMGVALQFPELPVLAARDTLAPALARVRIEPLTLGRVVKEQADALAKNWKQETALSDSDTARRSAELVLAIVANALRAALHQACGLAEDVTHLGPAMLAAAQGLAGEFGRSGTSRAIRVVQAALSRLERHANAALVFDALGIELAAAGRRRVASAAARR
ncbi:MAG: hypothetical protein U1A27_08535 [Phycisphaerae bacterium]